MEESTGEVCGFDKEPCSSRPLLISSEQRFVELSVNRYSACGITTEEELYCWGSNDGWPLIRPISERKAPGGLLGDGTTRVYSPIPIRVEDPDH
jgi:hypothetical protein